MGGSRRSMLGPLVVVALALAFLAVSPVTGARVQRHAPLPPAPSATLASADAPLLAKLRRGHQRERNGLLESAEDDYAEALASDSEEITAAARAGLARIERARARLGFVFPVVATLAGASFGGRVLVLGIAAAVLLTWILRLLRPRRGTQVTRFAVYGCDDPAAPASFQSALLAHSNEIKRVYGSDYARRAGIQLFFSDLTGSALAEAPTIDQALADARDVDAKAAVGFALRQALHYVRGVTDQPRFSVAGSVRFVPGGANVTARIRDLETGQESSLDASTAELAGMSRRAFVESELLRLPAGHRGRPESAPDADRRNVARQLDGLALVLASKIRWRESQGVSLDQRPAGWQTVCLFVAASRNLT